jgi:hypothetical protein
VSGLSGAVIEVGDNIVLKRGGGPRTVDQGRWLVDYRHEVLPRVHAVLDDGYMMERLDEVDVDLVDLGELVKSLVIGVWSRPATTSWVREATATKVARIMDDYDPHLEAAVLDLVERIPETLNCMTHGDPTAENVMLRDGRQVVIDPIPATTAVPNQLGVDVGKIMQSAVGWEQFKGGRRASFTVDEVADYFDPRTAEAGRGWCIIHLIRTLPYASKEVRIRVIASIEELLGV